MTKGDLMKLALSEEEREHCDTAIPMHLWKTCDTSLCVFDCKNNQVVNLAERLVTSGKLQTIVDEKRFAEYKLKIANNKIQKVASLGYSI